VLELGVKTLLSYLLGSLIGSLLLGRLKGVDIREQGSGNAGSTNALRTQGWAFAAGVLLVDVGKALLAVGLLPGLALPLVGYDASVDGEWLAVACAIAVVVGHVYPVWYEFRGGKGAATLLGTVAVLAPVALLPILAIWLGCVIVTGYVGLGTMLGVASLPVYVGYAWPGDMPLLAFGVVMALFVAYTHRANIRRMLDGNESRARRLWLMRPR
jgi:acyl phosphate:glycerol-3-phosphate acyltransferase